MNSKKTRFIFGFALCGFFLGGLFPARPALAAATDPAACTLTPEAIVTLTVPVYARAAVWDARFADKAARNVVFSGGTLLPNGNILATGQVQGVTGDPATSLIVEMDTRARIIADQRAKAAPGDVPGPLLRMADGALITAETIRLPAREKNRQAVHITRYNDAFQRKGSLTLKVPGFDDKPAALAGAPDGKSFFLIANATGAKNTHTEHGVIYHFSENGHILWQHALRPGTANALYGIAPAGNGQTVISGRVRGDDGRMAGWLLLLNADGTIAWQGTFPRGRTAILRAAAVKRGAPDGDHIIAVGQIIPYGDSAPAAAWAMELDSTHSVVWQRYFRANDYNLNARALLVAPDGRSTVMVNATLLAPDTDGSNHVRLLTLSPRGQLLDDETYMQGRSASALQLLSAPNHDRIVIGTATAKIGGGQPQPLITARIADQKTNQKTEAPAEPKPQKDILRTQGWAFAAVPLPHFDDPCIIKHETPAP